MSNITDLFRAFWLDEIHDIGETSNKGIKDSLIDGQIIFDETLYISSKKSSYPFLCLSPNIMKEAVVYEINKYCSASFETVAGASAGREINNSTAWPAIRAYYSAFFAANASIRFCGHSSTFIDQNLARDINKLVAINHIPLLSPGNYHITFSSDCTNLSLKKVNRAHEDMWNIYGELLTSLVTDQRVSSLINNECMTCIIELLHILRMDANGTKYNWLSYMRNKINYTSYEETWYPHKGAKKFKKKVFEYIEQWKKDPTNIIKNEPYEIVKFIQACTLVTSITRELVTDLYSRGAMNKKYLKSGAIAILKQC